jgi:hypothetical protein
MAIPAELTDVQRRFATATHDNAAWMRDYAAKYEHLRPGEVLPYDPHMGISEGEYARLTDAYAHPSEMTLYKFHAHREEIADGFRVVPDGDHDARADVLRDLRWSTRGSVLYKDIETPQGAQVQGLHGKFGTWSGRAWKREGGDPTGGPSDALEVEVGVVQGRTTFLHVHRTRSDGKVLVEQIESLFWLSPENIENASSGAVR